jgi:hypothetical protein
MVASRIVVANGVITMVQYLIADVASFSKLIEKLAWLNVNEPRILGAEGHDLLQFVAGQHADKVAELEEALAEADRVAA